MMLDRLGMVVVAVDVVGMAGVNVVEQAMRMDDRLAHWDPTWLTEADGGAGI